MRKHVVKKKDIIRISVCLTVPLKMTPVEKKLTHFKTGLQRTKTNKHKVKAVEWEFKKEKTIKWTISAPFCFICRIELIKKSTGLGPSTEGCRPVCGVKEYNTP